MARIGIPLLVLIALFVCQDATRATSSDVLMGDAAAAQHGLTRAWFTQVELDRARSRLVHLVLYGRTLYALTDRAVLHAMDAETGQTLWVVQVGRPGGLIMAPAANDRMVAVVNGSYLYVLDRNTGKLAWQMLLDGAPGTGPVLSDQRVYVPMTRGKVLSYRLTPVQPATTQEGSAATPGAPHSPAAPSGAASVPSASAAAASAAAPAAKPALELQATLAAPLACQSTGRTLVQPVLIRETAGEEVLAWPTDAGYLYVAGIERGKEDRFSIRYRLETAAGIAASPAYLRGDPKTPGEGRIFIPGEDGFVYALRQQDGQTLWRFPAGEAMVEPIAAIDGRLYVPTRSGGMYCLDTQGGQQIWWAADVVRFIAASKDRVYAADKVGNIQVIGVANGARLDTIPAIALPMKLFNTDNDRLYLASEAGLVQCLHESDLPQPLVHNRPAPAEKAAPEDASAAHTPAAHAAAPPAAHPAVPAVHPQAKPARPPAKQPASRPSGAKGKNGGANGKPAAGSDPFGGAGGGNPF